MSELLAIQKKLIMDNENEYEALLKDISTIIYDKGNYASGYNSFTNAFSSGGSVSYNSNNITITMPTSGGTYNCIKLSNVSLISGQKLIVEYSLSGFQNPGSGKPTTGTSVFSIFGYGTNLSAPSSYSSAPQGAVKYLRGSKTSTCFIVGNNLEAILNVENTGTYDIFIDMPQGYVDASNGTFVLHRLLLVK